MSRATDDMLDSASDPSNSLLVTRDRLHEKILHGLLLAAAGASHRLIGRSIPVDEDPLVRAHVSWASLIPVLVDEDAALLTTVAGSPHAQAQTVVLVVVEPGVGLDLRLLRRLDH